MAKPLLYFLVDHPKQIVTANDAIDWGLGHVCTPRSAVECTRDSNGPGGHGGVTTSIDFSGGRYRPEKQTWIAGPDGKWWVGYINDERPGPDELARKKMYPGHAVELLDGNEWIIPTALALVPTVQITLPAIYGMQDGRIVSKIHPRYRRLCERAFDAWLEWTGSKEPSKNDDEWIALAIDALAVNYRVGPTEVAGLLNLIGSDEVLAIIRALLDINAVQAYTREQLAASQKKTPEQAKESPSPKSDASTNSGVAASSPATA
ncbi:MAG TPA: hypothetical protein VH370_08020 [Humisphaera sp.]|jgi:hypothetical protein|nr:hypothetical protein [Humisphaera sp.]